MKEEFFQISSSNERTAQETSTNWTPPSQESVKLNVDVAYCLENKVASLGMVVRNDTGTICLWAIMKICNVESPLHAELKAITFGLEVTRDNSFLSILVESDSLLAIQEILKHQRSFCQWESIISDITDMSLEYGHCRFNHIRRYANEYAHNVAKLPCELGNYIVWRNTIPHSLCNSDIITWRMKWSIFNRKKYIFTF